VEDVVDLTNPRRPIVHGTKVSADVLSVDRDTLFPLQAHLGYELTQSLFVGKNTLLVEGPSDILYLQVFSQALRKRSRVGLDISWTICPTGGIDKVWSFVSLFGGNNINIAVLCDYGVGDKGKVEKLRQSQILKSGRVLTAADFTEKTESDIEDLIHPALYAEIVNQAFQLNSHKVTQATLDPKKSGHQRIVKATEDHFRTMPPEAPEFNHFVPAEFVLRNPELLDKAEKSVEQTLASFEKVFVAINGFL
jgi:hypothetical protein